MQPFKCASSCNFSAICLYMKYWAFQGHIYQLLNKEWHSDIRCIYKYFVQNVYHCFNPLPCAHWPKVFVSVGAARRGTLYCEHTARLLTSRSTTSVITSQGCCCKSLTAGVQQLKLNCIREPVKGQGGPTPTP